MVFLAIIIVAAVIVLAGMCLAAAGLRDGDRPADATVSARLRHADQPDEPRPVVVATVCNPSGTPVLAGMSARRTRAPRWLGGGHNIIVPVWTARRGLRPTGYATVGVIGAYGSARFQVPVAAGARRYLLTAAVGQAGGRLRLHRLHVTGAVWPARAGLTVPFGEGLFD